LARHRRILSPCVVVTSRMVTFCKLVSIISKSPDKPYKACITTYPTGLHMVYTIESACTSLAVRQPRPSLASCFKLTYYIVLLLTTTLSMSPPLDNLVLSAEPGDIKQVVDTKSDDPSGQDGDQVVISSISKNEPLVTRQELWSYYRAWMYTPTLFLH
jgi:hypothetical protein